MKESVENERTFWVPQQYHVVKNYGFITLFFCKSRKIYYGAAILFYSLTLSVIIDIIITGLHYC